MKNLFVLSLLGIALLSFTNPAKNEKAAKIFGIEVTASWLEKGQVSDDGTSKTCIYCKKFRFLCMCIQKFDIDVDFEFGIAGPKENDGLFGGVISFDKNQSLVLNIVKSTVNRKEMSWLTDDRTKVEDEIYLGPEVVALLKEQGYRGKGLIYPGSYVVKETSLAGHPTYQIVFPAKKEASKSATINFPIKVRVGSHLFENCAGDNPCGPCRGICVRWEPKPANEPKDFLTAEERKKGTRIVNIRMLNRKQLEITFLDDDYDNGNKMHGVEKNLDLGKEIAELLQVKRVVIKRGTYPIDYSKSEFGQSIVSIRVVR